MIYNSILETIGKTPLVRLNRLPGKATAEIFAKLEYFNPGGSVKDRMALALIEDGETRGQLKPGGTIVEPTSGNTGIGLALVAAVRGYNCILVMPESMSLERRKMIASLGAKVELTPADGGMKGALARADELLDEIEGAWSPGQFSNPANPEMHRRTTGPEIWQQTEGRLHYLVAGIGTGGTLTGSVRFLKEKDPGIRAVAVEPADSPVLSGGAGGPHRIQGIGAGFIPEVVDRELLDEIITVESEKAIEISRLLSREEGITAGISAGAAVQAALELAARPGMDRKRIVVIIPDTSERYLSTVLFEDSDGA